MLPSDHHRPEGAVRRALAVVTGAAALLAPVMLASLAGLLPSLALADHAPSGRAVTAIRSASDPAAGLQVPHEPADPAAAAAAAAGPGDLPSVELAVRPVPTGATPAASIAPSVPVELSLPTIGVTSSLEHLARQADGSIAAPVDFDLAGWFDAGPQPGQPGPAVIAGHVDSTTGPAVFYRLRELRPGDPVEVHREDGSVVTFRVTHTEQHPKDQFPSEAVYGPVPGAELRLITCGGGFDRDSGHYLDNLVVFAVAA
jgi:hypothetical protein